MQKNFIMKKNVLILICIIGFGLNANGQWTINEKQINNAYRNTTGPSKNDLNRELEKSIREQGGSNNTNVNNTGTNHTTPRIINTPSTPKYTHNGTDYPTKAAMDAVIKKEKEEAEKKNFLENVKPKVDAEFKSVNSTSNATKSGFKSVNSTSNTTESGFRSVNSTSNTSGFKSVNSTESGFRAVNSTNNTSGGLKTIESTNYTQYSHSNNYIPQNPTVNTNSNNTINNQVNTTSSARPKIDQTTFNSKDAKKEIAKFVYTYSNKNMVNSAIDKTGEVVSIVICDKANYERTASSDCVIKTVVSKVTSLVSDKADNYYTNAKENILGVNSSLSDGINDLKEDIIRYCEDNIGMPLKKFTEDMKVFAKKTPNLAENVSEHVKAATREEITTSEESNKRFESYAKPYGKTMIEQAVK